MTGQVIVGAGDVKRAPDGSVGVHIDEFPEEAALLRWKNHEFLEIERAAAKGWRAELAQHDPDRIIGVLKNIIPPDETISNLDELKAFVDTFCASISSPGQHPGSKDPAKPGPAHPDSCAEECGRQHEAHGCESD